MPTCHLRFEQATANTGAPVLHYAVTHTERADPPPSPDAQQADEASIGRVWFHFLYHRNLRRRSEVTERSSCPFCTLECSSFQGLQEHLLASHDAFTYTFSDPVRCGRPPSLILPDASR